MSQFRLVSLKVQGFRGFPETAGPREFKFDQACLLLFGCQGGAKSSTLHAIEWGLFGDRVAKATETGIAQRKGWVVRNTRSTEATVELTFARGGERLKVFRSDGKARGHSGFYFQIDGKPKCDQEEELRRLLGAELRDYLSCVHLHQEVIDALLVEEPSARKNALDRLLGLADLRNFADGLKKAGVRDHLKEGDRIFGDLEADAGRTMRIRESDLSNAVTTAKAHGIEETALTFEGAKAACESLATQIQTFAADSGLAAAVLPKVDTFETLRAFFGVARDSVRKLRGEQPNLKHRSELTNRVQKLEGLKSDYTATLSRQKDIETRLRELEQKHGLLPTAKSRLEAIQTSLLPDATKRLNVINNRAGIFREAIKFFETAKTEETRSCPICQKSSFDVRQFRQHAQHWEQDMHLLLAPVQKEIAQLESEAFALNLALQQAQPLAQQLEAIRQEAQQAAAALKALEPKSGEEPLTLVNQAIENLKTQIANSQSAVEQSNVRLNRIEDGLERIKQIGSTLRIKREINELLELKETPEYKELEAARRALHSLAEQIKIIEEAARAVLSTLAAQKVQATKQAITSIYRALAQRSDYPEIAIHPERFEVMAVSDGQSEVALRILNKGDLNCAALSIFLALATSNQLTHKLGFIVLDDPSQSLDLPHKARLAELLARLLGDKQLILATSEEDFMAQLRAKLPKNKLTYTMNRWAAETGPEISISFS